jgi:hypothetical protein
VNDSLLADLAKAWSRGGDFLGLVIPGIAKQPLACIIQGVRLKDRVTWLLGLLCASVPFLLQQDRPPAADSDRDTDTRAIYSWLITHLAGQDKLYLIAPETDQYEYPNERCLDVPPDHSADIEVTLTP